MKKRKTPDLEKYLEGKKRRFVNYTQGAKIYKMSYQKNWTLDIQNMSWVGDTNRQVDFLIKQLHLKGTEKILDLACGFGRHSLEFARRGYDVTGIDITPAYIDYANEQAKRENLNAKFICQDIRTITFDKEFDVVLNMADGAIGYLEDDEENHKIFSVIAKALKNGGKHFMDIINGSVFENHNGRHLLPFFT